MRILIRRLRVFTRTVSICNGKDDKRDKKKQYVYDTCTNELVNFKPGENMRKMFFFFFPSVTEAARKKTSENFQQESNL